MPTWTPTPFRIGDIDAYTYTNTTNATTCTIPYSNTLHIDYPTFVTSRELDDFAKKIYKIIEDHTYIDISEDEFMNIIKGGQQN